MPKRKKDYHQHTKKISGHNTHLQRVYRPEEFEDIKLPTKPPERNEEEFEEIDISSIASGVSPPSEQLLSAKQQLEQQLLFNVTEQAFSAQSGTKTYGFENIIGVGISQKLMNNRYTNMLSITVYVVAKVPEHELEPQACVPKEINGIPTDVVETGEFHAFPHRGVYRPAQGGVSMGHYQITAGTLGCLVRRGSALYILSNNHVLANSNMGMAGDPILQPGPYDGGKLPDHVIAQLSEFVPIQFGGPQNLVDTAIAQASPSLVSPLSKCFGRISSTPISCQRFQIVKKCGRTTQYSIGLVTDCNATIRVGYGTFGTAIFQDQMLIQGVPFIYPFSSPGDSGSLVVTEFTNRPVGLLFAGSFLFSVANKIENVLSYLNVSIVT